MSLIGFLTSGMIFLPRLLARLMDRLGWFRPHPPLTRPQTLQKRAGHPRSTYVTSPGSPGRAWPGSPWRGPPSLPPRRCVRSCVAGRRSSPGSWPRTDAPVPGPSPRLPVVPFGCSRVPGKWDRPAQCLFDFPPSFGKIFQTEPPHELFSSRLQGGPVGLRVRSGLQRSWCQIVRPAEVKEGSSCAPSPRDHGRDRGSIP